MTTTNCEKCKNFAYPKMKEIMEKNKPLVGAFYYFVTNHGHIVIGQVVMDDVFILTYPNVKYTIVEEEN